MTNLIKLIKHNGEYYWVDGNNATMPMKEASAKSFGVWWLKIKREQVETGISLIKETHNTAFFSDRGDFLYVDTLQGKT